MNLPKKRPEVRIVYDDLELAYRWIDVPTGETSAYISKTTGQIFWHSATLDHVEELPDDVHDPDLYWTVPDKHDLRLGSESAVAFIERRAPHLSAEVREIFARRGAYGRFESLPVRDGLLNDWHAWENSQTEAALRSWAEREGICLVDEPPTSDPRPFDDA